MTMKIGIIGGTGDIGEGMALRMSPHHDVILGSRDPEKACTTTTCCIDTLCGRGQTCSLTGVSNQEAVNKGDVIILAIPFAHVRPTLAGLTGFEGKIVVSPVNPMEKKDYFMFVPPPEGSAAMLIRSLLPPGAHVCTAFNTIAANRWHALDEELEYAVPVCGDDPAAKKIVMELAGTTSKLKAYDAGPLAGSGMVESLTPLLLNIARYNRMKDVGIRFL